MGMFKREKSGRSRGGSSRSYQALKYGYEYYYDAAGRLRQRKTEWLKEEEKAQAQEEKEQQEAEEREAQRMPEHIWEQDEKGCWSQRPMTPEEIEAEEERKIEAIRQQEEAEEQARAFQERYEKEQAEIKERMRRQQRDASLTAENLSTEFKTIFESARPDMHVYHDLSSGSLDASALPSLFSGNTDIFMRREIVDKPTVAGSMAVVVASADALHYLEDYNTEQCEIWLYVLKTLEAAAEKCNLKFSLFSSHATDLRKPEEGAVIRFNSVRSMTDVADTSFDNYPRHKLAIQKANEWHEQVNPGGDRRVTLMVTMFPENPGGKVNTDMEKYREWLIESAAKMRQASTGSELFCIGIRLNDGREKLEGCWVQYGLQNHFDTLHADNKRYLLDSREALNNTISLISGDVARV